MKLYYKEAALTLNDARAASFIVLFVGNEFFNMINVIPDERFLLRAYVLDNIMGSSPDIFKASSQV